jgi:hypothetical protein
MCNIMQALTRSYPIPCCRGPCLLSTKAVTITAVILGSALCLSHQLGLCALPHGVLLNNVQKTCRHPRRVPTAKIVCAGNPSNRPHTRHGKQATRPSTASTFLAGVLAMSLSPENVPPLAAVHVRCGDRAAGTYTTCVNSLVCNDAHPTILHTWEGSTKSYCWLCSLRCWMVELHQLPHLWTAAH